VSSVPGSDLTYRVVVRILGMLYRLMGYRVDVRGIEHIPAGGGSPTIAVGAHPTRRTAAVLDREAVARIGDSFD
jgi:1-acyl-sn-glycerol-3-phosphate acyltransferase